MERRERDGLRAVSDDRARWRLVGELSIEAADRMLEQANRVNNMGDSENQRGDDAAQRKPKP